MNFGGVEGVFTDMDGTLTTSGRVLPSTYAAMAALQEAGVRVVIVTGRPAGWGEAICRLWPVTAVVAENGGVRFFPDKRGGLHKRLAVASPQLPRLRQRMYEVAERATRAVRGARLSTDAPYTEVNLAIDWNEAVHLSVADARRLEEFLRKEGYTAVRSSVHVNFWPGRFDKLTACRKLVREVFRNEEKDLGPYVYVGDALNDEPMFGGFPRSVGVANVRAVWEELRARPGHVTRAAEGKGFEEVARAILRERRRGPGPKVRPSRGDSPALVRGARNGANGENGGNGVKAAHGVNGVAHDRRGRKPSGGDGDESS